MALNHEIEIEKSVQARNRGIATGLIRKWHRENPRNEKVVVQCCDWLRRLGLYEEGFRLLDLKSLLKEGASPLARTHFLWGARFLNNLGASRMALRLIGNQAPRSHVELRIMGNIFLSNFQYQAARECFERIHRSLRDQEPTYEDRLSMIGLADALGGLGDFPAAREVLLSLIPGAKEPLFKGIVLQAIGETYAQDRKFPEALIWLEKGTPYFSKRDTSPDHAFMMKWLGYVEAHLGRKREGEQKLDLALSWLRLNRVREESWIDVLKLKAELGFISPSDRSRLTRYPGLPEEYLNRMKEFLGETQIRELENSEGASPLMIDLKNNEMTEKGKNRLGVPLELRYAAYASLSQPWSMTKTRMKDCLWPDEPHAFSEMENRLKQLILRSSRVYRFESRIKGSVIRVSPKNRDKVRVLERQRPTLLEKSRSFTKAEAATHYGLSHSQIQITLKSWVKNGWIQRTSGMKKAVYQVIADGGLLW